MIGKTIAILHCLNGLYFTLGVVDKVFARVGASDNLTKGLSTFYTEMIETSHIIGTAMPSSFVVLDEIGIMINN